MNTPADQNRRRFIQTALVTGTGVLIAGCSSSSAPSAAPGPAAAAPQGEDVSPVEDLMREHGVLQRVLLAYEECARRIETKQDLPPEPLADAARLVHTFIEDYHEKLEEEHLFPRYRAAGKLGDLIDVLLVQHAAGRRTTARIEILANLRGIRDGADSRELVVRLREFIRMYRPHASREDTILLPMLHQIVTPEEYDKLGDQFEAIERAQLGEEGFERAVVQIAEIEARLGIADLAQFTPAT